MLLDFPNGHRNRRLRHIQPARRLRQVIPAFADRQKNTHMFDRQCSPLPIYYINFSMIYIKLYNFIYMLASDIIITNLQGEWDIPPLLLAGFPILRYVESLFEK
mgnify:CR=1 FL=1